MASKRALITGVAGQDGWYLARTLMGRGYEVIGTVRPGGHRADLPPAVVVHETDLARAGELARLSRDTQPQEIYYLAAHHSSTEGRDHERDLARFLAVNLETPAAILDLMRFELPEARLFYASSCHVFGTPTSSPQDEDTPQAPESLYAITKSAAGHLCRLYRRRYGLHASVGILYNHESPRRGETFITARLARAAALAARGKPELTLVRDLGATVDWGSARDFVEAMWQILQRPSGDDYVVATGELHSVADFAAEAFRCVGMNATGWVRQDPGFTTEEGARYYLGNSSKLSAACGWRPRVGFAELVRELVDGQLATV